MNFPPAFPGWLAAVIATLVVLSFTIYASLLREVLRHGGKISAREFDLPDLFLGSFFAAWFGIAIARGLHAESRPITDREMIHGALVFLGLVAGIAGFLRYRGIAIARQFGMRWTLLLKTLLAPAFILVAYPALALVSRLTEVALGPRAEPQPLVKFFLEAAEKSNHTTIAITLLLGVIVAPFTEEFLFRGYLYGVMKRYCGILPAMMLSSALFAAIHLNLSSLPALFLLALCLAIAYETTGSILVNMSMHALFNLTMFLLMLKLPHHLP